MNMQLLSLVFTIASGVTIGVFMTIALVVGFDEIPHIIGACVVGLVLSLPITYIVAKKLQSFSIAREKSTVTAK